MNDECSNNIIANNTSHTLISQQNATLKMLNTTANITVRRTSKYIYGDVGKRKFNLTTRRITIIHYRM